MIHSADEVSVENGNFEIRQWPQPGWREMDPGTGDEAGTTEGQFNVRWKGDFFCEASTRPTTHSCQNRP